MIQSGYVLQAMSLRNLGVFLLAAGCNVGRALVEERLLSESASYRTYRQRVRWRMVPGLW